MEYTKLVSSIDDIEPSDAIRVVNSLLTQLDKIKNYSNVFVLTTTNITEAIDSAFLDRADICVYIGNPTPEIIYCILKSCLIEMMMKKLIQPSDQLISQRALNYMEFADTKVSKSSLGFSGRALRKLPFLSHAKYIKKPVFTMIDDMGVLENLMKETVTPERMGEHAEFCTIARRLIRDLRGQTAGSCVDKVGDLRPDQVRKMEIVGRTQAQWDSQELLQLIYQHLQQTGFNDVADLLRRQALLSVDDRENLSLYEDACVQSPLPFTGRLLGAQTTPKRTLDNRFNMLTASTPICTDANTSLRPKLYRDSINQTSILAESMPPPATPGKSSTTLNDIVETFLRTQHAQCPNPISICPKFSLHTKHICPSVADQHRPANILHYITRRSYDSTHHTLNNRMLHRYVHRTFKPRVVLNESDVFADDRFSEVFCFAKGLEDGLFFASENSGIVFTDVDQAQASVEKDEVNRLQDLISGIVSMATVATVSISVCVT